MFSDECKEALKAVADDRKLKTVARVIQQNPHIDFTKVSWIWDENAELEAFVDESGNVIDVNIKGDGKIIQ